jgi:uridine phosphorylase
MQKDYPILEYDGELEAMIDPQKLIKPRPDMPEHGVICFFFDVINHFAEQKLIRRITAIRTEMGDHPVYELPWEGRSVALFHPGVGAPLAAGLTEEMIALGCRKFIACGGAGVLDREIAVGHLIIPVSAVRDEGTSYHYLPPAREVGPTPEAVAAIETVLKSRKIDYLLAKTWTTDAFYRETRKKVALRKAEGCLTVEMEAAALFAVAQFRRVQIGQILYGGDNLDGEIWDGRDWESNWTVREKLIGLAAEACLLLRKYDRRRLTADRQVNE